MEEPRKHCKQNARYCCFYKRIEININQSEFALHNDNDYLIKLYFLYNENIENKESSNLVSLSEFSKFQNKEIIIVGLK